ncbi:NUDIX hydrolase [Niveibacterium sp. 24ML]|uniref:NUDIX domain-containing protein n=1 Tax=Niveibacterium sp. 24ML TaxID=2985512 RepID=UPI0022714A9D|nr:NUDIX hydrolase [Niveibacterium sp. 24ML]MCX9155195.1 NUDIX hydrolase [Niveibacterium sp. 24ML]
MSSDDRLVEIRLESTQVFDGCLLKVFKDTVGRVGASGEWVREYIHHPGAAVILAIADSGNLLMERQFRYPLGRVVWELPAGKLDPGESIEACARRELREETGYDAAEWAHLGTMHPAVGYSDERIEIFLARQLTHVGDALDADESLEVFEICLADAEDAVFDGRITDGKTIAGLFWLARVLRAKESGGVAA